eukprot:CAMPEP_0116843564 /NCGR_PEP_ID=MMETSP0418-20121206/12159_1 /TAXON_ID=1158023 /ORGANISM="Astrosyne radiata, Strain 13vi08-1A" /LENGTH=128 /DNA_ID=CAMNT_0004474333 /DNA_START=222 /DNA_END=608 /DNA_ORIENTATION=-
MTQDEDLDLTPKPKRRIGFRPFACCMPRHAEMFDDESTFLEDILDFPQEAEPSTLSTRSGKTASTLLLSTRSSPSEGGLLFVIFNAVLFYFFLQLEKKETQQRRTLAPAPSRSNKPRSAIKAKSQKKK